MKKQRAKSVKAWALWESDGSGIYVIADHPLMIFLNRNEARSEALHFECSFRPVIVHEAPKGKR
jgi:hypothetical protein